MAFAQLGHHPTHVADVVCAQIGNHLVHGFGDFGLGQLTRQEFLNDADFLDLLGGQFQPPALFIGLRGFPGVA